MDVAKGEDHDSGFTAQRIHRHIEGAKDEDEAYGLTALADSPAYVIAVPLSSRTQLT